MPVIYPTECSSDIARELAVLTLEAYQLYYGSKANGHFPERLITENGEYRILTVFKAKPTTLAKRKVLGYIAQRDDVVYILFRGTEAPSEWLGNGKFIQVKFIEGWGKIHRGFKAIYKTCSSEIITTLCALSPEVSKIYVAGHSLGAAISTLACADIIEKTRFQELTHYTYASPRVGNKEFYDKFQQHIRSSYRFINTEDVVTTEPKAVTIAPVNQYVHVGIPLAFTYQGGSFLENHLLESYIKHL
jgi:triacylglycerol lipase